MKDATSPVGPIRVRPWIEALADLGSGDLELTGLQLGVDRSTATYRLFNFVERFVTVELVRGKSSSRLRAFFTMYTADIEVEFEREIAWD